MEDNNNMEENEQKLENEVAPALIAIHPAQKSISVAVGSNLRVFNLEIGSEAKLTDENGGHKDSIRAIKYSKSGRLFVSSGDDKIVKIWETDSWHCVYSVVSDKRVTAVAISGDEMFVCFADKFGVVYVVDIGGECGLESSAVVVKKAVPILSHYCSIITRLEFSPDRNYIVSADRDFKIRVTVFPKKPLDGTHEIQSFCLGHTEFVSCLAYVSSPDHSQHFLISGSGDSTVRLWEHSSGCLLDTCNVADMAGLQHATEQEDICFAVTDLCTNSDGSLVAVAIQSLPGMVLLRCNLSAKTLSLIKVVRITGEAFIPTSLGASLSSPLLWMVMGASSLQHAHASESLARVRVISGFTQVNDSQSVEPDMLVLEDNAIPGGESLLQSLQGKLSIGNEAFSMVAEAVKTSMRNLMIKKQYSAERREVRKKGRNDKKNTVIV